MTSPMRVVVTGLLLGLGVVTLTPTSTSAAPQDESPLEPGEVGLFYDAAGTQRVASIPAFANFDLYLVARIPAGGVAEYDLVELEFPLGTLLASAPPALPEGSPFDPRVVFDACSYASWPNPPACPVNEGQVVPLVRYSMQRIGGSATTHVCLENYLCNSFAGPVPSPVRYRSCENPALSLQFTTGRFECLSLDGTVETEVRSWSTAKGWFGRKDGQ